MKVVTMKTFYLNLVFVPPQSVLCERTTNPNPTSIPWFWIQDPVVSLTLGFSNSFHLILNIHRVIAVRDYLYNLRKIVWKDS